MGHRPQQVTAYVVRTKIGRQQEKKERDRERESERVRGSSCSRFVAHATENLLTSCGAPKKVNMMDSASVYVRGEREMERERGREREKEGEKERRATANRAKKAVEEAAKKKQHIHGKDNRFVVVGVAVIAVVFVAAAVVYALNKFLQQLSREKQKTNRQKKEKNPKASGK